MTIRMNGLKLTLFMCCFFPYFVIGNQLPICKKVGIVANWPPLTGYDASGPYGLDVDIVRAIFKQANICINFVRLPTSARTFEEMNKGFIDVAAMTSFTPERQKYGIFSLSYRDEKMRLLSLLPSRKLYSLEGLVKNNKLIGLSIGSYYGEEVDTLLTKKDTKNQFVGIASAKSRVEMLLKHRVDFVIDDLISAHYYKSKLGFKKINIWPYVVHDNPVHLLLRHKAFTNEEVVTINDAIVLLKPEIDKFLINYLKQH